MVQWINWDTHEAVVLVGLRDLEERTRRTEHGRDEGCTSHLTFLHYAIISIGAPKGTRASQGTGMVNEECGCEQRARRSFGERGFSAGNHRHVFTAVSSLTCGLPQTIMPVS